MSIELEELQKETNLNDQINTNKYEIESINNGLNDVNNNLTEVNKEILALENDNINDNKELPKLRKE